MKDHDIRETVSRVQELCFQFRDSQQLRERIANVLVPVLKAAIAPSDAAQGAQISFDQPALPSPDAQCEAQYGGHVITYHSDEQIIRYAEECVAAAIAAHTSRAAPVPPAAAAPQDQQSTRPKSA